MPLFRKLRAPTAAAAVALALLASPSLAKIDLVTLPERDETELTIYNSQDLTLTRETRTLSFDEGSNQIQFSWANTLIDPTSLHINVESNPNLEVVDAVYPANTEDLIVWNIEAAEETSAPVEISYFISGLTWGSGYVIKANNAETEFSLQQFITVRNDSGEDFENAKTRVVVGEVNLEELIRELARKGVTVTREQARRAVASFGMRQEEMARESAPRALAMDAAAMPREAKEIIKKAVSEYHIFAVEGEEDIQNGWGKELPNPKVSGIPFDLSYEIDPQKYGPAAVKFYKLKNDESHELGEEPLPEGQFYVYSDDGRGGLRLEGTTSHDYIPVGEDIELNLGSDGLVLYEERLMDMEREEFEFDSDRNLTGWDELRQKELEIKNSRDREVPVKLTHHINGSWEMEDVSHSDYEKVDQNTVRWEMTLPPNSKTIIDYTVRVHQGSRARQ